MIVVHTNVMVYLLAGDGARAEQAASLLQRDPEWVAPPILLSELRNVLVGSVRRGLLEPAVRQDWFLQDMAASALDLVAAVWNYSFCFLDLSCL